MAVTKKYISENPQLIEEWNWEKNIEFDPSQLTVGSGIKVCWKCSNGHEYEARIADRKAGCGCPYCAGKKVLIGYNDLATFYPDVAKDWNYERNMNFTPTTVIYGSNKKVWWKCKSCGGEYEAIISNRTRMGSGCPYCANQKVLVGFNDLQSRSPELATEWSDKNTLKPTEVTLHSNKKVYWRCALGHDDYLMSVKQRSNRQGCPVCAQQSQTSFPEQAIYFYLKQLFSDVTNRYIYDNHEIDIFIPSKNLGIEYNGYFAHKKKAEKDAAKKDFFANIGITLLVVKEYKTDSEKLDADFYIHERTSYEQLTALINEILNYLGCKLNIIVDCKRDAISIKNQYIALRKENSIATVRPDLIERWDYEKNGSITPEMITLGTGQRYYWKCKICGRSYLAYATSIAEGSVCSNHRNLTKYAGNDLESKHPELLKYWDYEKNDVLPSKIYGGGERVVYWKCEKGHSYTKSILKHIRGEGCPICAGKRVLQGYNDLATAAPKVAQTWNFAKNGDALPTQFTAHSNKTFWWICEQGHEWEAKITNRVNGRGCPICYQLQRGARRINLYDAHTLSLISTFDSVKALCEYLNMDYDNMNAAVSNVCRRKQKTLLRKYIVRNADDDEIGGK